jgi:uncharacterized membrane protein
MPEDKDKRFENTLEVMAKGILIGGSLGAIAGWFFMDTARALMLGALTGCLASLSLRSLRERRKK